MKETYYTIKDVSMKTGMSPSTLRYYDKEGLLSFVKRNNAGIRMFTEEDFENLYTINCLKRSGMPLKKIKEFMDLYLSGNDTIHEKLVMFEQQRENILNNMKELEYMLEVVNYKCWYFKEAEKKGDVYYYKNMPEDERPDQINNFLERVKEFHSKKLKLLKIHILKYNF